jgi:hypothetical protein
MERRMEEGGLVVQQGAHLAGAGGGLPGVAAREQGRSGGSSQCGLQVGHCHGPAQAHSANFDLNKDF